MRRSVVAVAEARLLRLLLLLLLLLPVVTAVRIIEWGVHAACGGRDSVLAVVVIDLLSLSVVVRLLGAVGRAGVAAAVLLLRIRHCGGWLIAATLCEAWWALLVLRLRVAVGSWDGVAAVRIAVWRVGGLHVGVGSSWELLLLLLGVLLLLLAVLLLLLVVSSAALVRLR